MKNCLRWSLPTQIMAKDNLSDAVSIQHSSFCTKGKAVLSLTLKLISEMKLTFNLRPAFSFILFNNRSFHFQFYLPNAHIYNCYYTIHDSWHSSWFVVIVVPDNLSVWMCDQVEEFCTFDILMINSRRLKKYGDPRRATKAFFQFQTLNETWTWLPYIFPNPVSQTVLFPNDFFSEYPHAEHRIPESIFQWKGI